MFSATRTRVSTDNIGLARVRDGLELVRIGSPQRPEMAAWRYGDQFGRRRTQASALDGRRNRRRGRTRRARTGHRHRRRQRLGTVERREHGELRVSAAARSRATRAARSARAACGFVCKQLNQVALVGDDDGWALRVPFEDLVERSAARTGLFTERGADVSTVAARRCGAAGRGAAAAGDQLVRCEARRGERRRPNDRRGGRSGERCSSATRRSERLSRTVASA